MKEYFLYFDESGNLGVQDKYFVISCIATEQPKALYNKMNKILLHIKKNHKEAKWNGNEIKASSCKPWIKEKVIKGIVEKDVEISYIVADKHWIEEKLKEDKNCLYNYLLRILLDNFKNTFRNNKVNLILDNKTIKVESINSFKDYINVYLNYELKLNVDLTVAYMDSKDKEAYNIQAADYIANALFAYYEYNYDIYKLYFDNKIKYKEHFPKRKFGTIPLAVQEAAATK